MMRLLEYRYNILAEQPDSPSQPAHASESTQKSPTESGKRRKRSIGHKLVLLLWKNVLLRRRHWLLTAFEILLPALLFTLLLTIRILPNSAFVPHHVNETIFRSTGEEELKEILCRQYGMWAFSRCFVLPSRPGDIKIFYGPDTNFSWGVANHVASELGMPKKVLEVVDSNEDMDIAVRSSFFEANDSYAAFYLGIFIHNEENTDFDPDPDLPPNHLKYDLRLRKYWFTEQVYPFLQIPGPRNFTSNLNSNFASYGMDGFTLIQSIIDRYFIAQVTENDTYADSEKYQIQSQMYPYPAYMQDNGMSQFYGSALPTFIVLSLVLLSPSLIKSVVYEKETGVRELIRLMGMDGWLVWLGWFLHSFVVILIVVSLMTVLIKVEVTPLDDSSGGYLPPIVANSDPFFVWVLLILYGISSITFCFVIATFFSKPTLATTIGILIWLVSYFIPRTLMDYQYDTMTLAPKIVSCLLPNMAITWAFRVIAMFEGRGVGVQWYNLWDTGNPRDQLSSAMILLMLALDTFLFLLITWYVDQVSPGVYGVPQPWYFPFQRSYWCGVPPSDTIATHSSQFLNADDSCFEAEPEGLTPGIVIKNLRKEFKTLGGKTKVAVENVSMTCYKGQCTVLLGHNGAGKTTTMSILTGVYSATAGTAEVSGWNIATHLKEAREELGLCPQHNMLFVDLTVLQHLLFFGRLKGMTTKAAQRDAEELMDRLDLVEKRHMYGSQLSGGMKRKLCLAISLIGGSKVVILDEPSSGLDPESRRWVWQVIQGERGRRTVLVTTHHMEEADVLGDRVAIMASGTVVCAGSTLFLKNKFGDGYTLTVMVSESSSVKGIKQMVSQYLPDATLRSAQGGEITFKLPPTTALFAPLLDAFTKHKQQLGIRHLGLSLTSMEQVFLRVGEVLEGDGEPLPLQWKPNYESVSHDLKDIRNASNNIRGSQTHSQTLSGSQNLYGDLSGSRNLNGGPSGSQNLNGGLSGSQNLNGGLSGSQNLNGGLSGSQNLNGGLSGSQNLNGGLSGSQNLNGGLSGSQNGGSSGNQSLNGKVPEELSDGVSQGDVYSSQRYLYNSQSSIDERLTGRRLLGQRMRAFFIKRAIYFKRKWLFLVSQGLLPILVTALCIIVDATFFDDNSQEPPRDLSLTMFSFTSSYVHADPGLVDLDQTYKSLFWGDYKVNSTDNIQESLLAEAADELYIYRENSVCSAEFLNNGSKMALRILYQSVPYHPPGVSTSLVTNALLRHATNSTSYSISTTNRPLPPDRSWKVGDTNTSSSALMYTMIMPLALAFLSASFLVFPLQERETKAKQVQLLTGASPWALWTTTFLWDFLTYLASAFLIIIILVAFDTKDYFTVRQAPGALILLLLLYGWGSIPMAYVFSFPFQTAASGFAVLALINIVAGQIITTAVWALDLSNQPNLLTVSDVLNWITSIIPTYAAALGFQHLIDTSVQNAQCDMLDPTTKASLCQNLAESWPTNAFMICCPQCGEVGNKTCFHKRSYFLFDKPGMAPDLLTLFVNGIIFFFILFLIEAKFWEMFVSWVRDVCCKGKQVAVAEVMEQDEDVLDEAVAVDAMMQGESLEGVNDDVTLLVSELSKSFFRAPRPAVNKVSFRVGRGECLGLLGVNGAGKTTTFRMLTGDEQPSAGDARISNISLRSSPRKFVQQIGYCPQFDAVLGELTGVEMLMLMARLRGISEAKLKHTVSSLVSLVGMTECAERPCSTYSGGNRRKLSTAMALVGDPPLVFLDEPTSGVDPASRRRVWAAVSRAVSSGQSVVLTSHSMEECEALCSRIIIMSRGTLRCIGTTAHLKAKYGQGYSLQVKLRNDPEQPLDDAEVLQLKNTIKQQLHGATLTDEHKGMLAFQVSNIVSWGHLFAVMEGLKNGPAAEAKAGPDTLLATPLSLVEDYAASDTSLEQVFLSFARKADMENSAGCGITQL